MSSWKTWEGIVCTGGKTHQSRSTVLSRGRILSPGTDGKSSTLTVTVWRLSLTGDKRSSIYLVMVLATFCICCARAHLPIGKPAHQVTYAQPGLSEVV
jgi:hypothetical protein